jgi:hypothetical protein
MGFLQRIQIVRFLPVTEVASLMFGRDRETAIVREEYETPNDRNDRGILGLCSIALGR